MQAEIRLRSDATQEQLDLICAMMQEVRDVPGDVVEIGSWKCGTSGTIAATWPQRTVWAFDIFGGMPYGQERQKPWDYFADVDWNEVQEVAANFPNLKLVRGQHEETVPEFAKKKIPIALLFMDSDHYLTHKVSLEYLAPLVSPEGVILFHDWKFQEVRQAIVDSMNLEEWKMLQVDDLYDMGALRKS